jgi:hypothetical protein
VLTLDSDGRLPHPELIYSKSGKTGFAAMAVLYVVVVLEGLEGVRVLELRGIGACRRRWPVSPNRR